MRISLGGEPVPVPEPFAGMLKQHLKNRPNLRTAAGERAPLGGRSFALQNLVAEVPPPLVAELLGYSHQVTQRHAELAAQAWSRYVKWWL
jgi:hypothetical protein